MVTCKPIRCTFKLVIILRDIGGSILMDKQEEYYIFFTRPSIEINTKTHLLEFSTVTHVG